MSRFGDQFKLASEEFLEAVKEDIKVRGDGGDSVIDASVDPVTYAERIKVGGRSEGAEMVIHVRKQDWLNAGGERGVRIEARGKVVRANVIVDIDDDQLEIACGAFKGTSGLGL